MYMNSDLRVVKRNNGSDYKVHWILSYPKWLGQHYFRYVKFSDM